MSYSDPSNKRPSKQIILNLFIFSLILIFIRIILFQNELSQIKQLFINEQDIKANKIADSIHTQIKTSYETLRTVSLLPEVRALEREGQELSAPTNEAIVQLYNNIYSNIKLSEIYILSKDFNHSKINPLTQKEEAPILMFDRLIVGKYNKKKAPVPVPDSDSDSDSDSDLDSDSDSDSDSAPLSTSIENKITNTDKLQSNKNDEKDSELKEEEKSEIPESENFEYDLYKDQLFYLKQHFPKKIGLNNSSLPMISGHEIITCDNSELTKENFLKNNDEARLGIAFTVPKYDMDGNFNGAVSAILRSKVIKTFLSSGHYALINVKYDTKIIDSPSRTWLDSVPLFKKGLNNKNLIYSKIIPIKTNDLNEWLLWVAIPDSYFYKSKIYKNAVGHFYIELLLCLLIVLCFFYLQFKILRYDREFSEKNMELDKHKATLEKDNILLNVLSHDVANTLLAIKSCNLYLIENKKTLYDIDTIQKTEETVFKMMLATDLAINVFEHVKEINSSTNELAKLKLKLVPTHIDDIMTIALIVFEENLLKKNIKLTLKNYTGDSLFLCHKTSFCNSVFNNLISNAIKFSPINSEIIIRTMIEGTHFKIFIQDFGVGIPDNIAKKLFDKNKTNSRKGTDGEIGSGFGISLAKSYLEHSGARLSFITYSAGETGTTFKISLKMAH